MELFFEIDQTNLVILRHNLSARQARKGIINFDGDYVAAGYFPGVGVMPTYDPQIEVRKNPTYEIVGETVVISWEVVDKTLEAVKAQRGEDLRTTFEANRDKGITVGGIDIATTHETRVELAALVERLAASGGSQKAVTRSGMRIDADLTSAQAMLAGIDDHHAKCATHEYDLNKLIDDAESVADVIAVDIDAGW